MNTSLCNRLLREFAVILIATDYNDTVRPLSGPGTIAPFVRYACFQLSASLLWRVPRDVTLQVRLLQERLAAPRPVALVRTDAGVRADVLLHVGQLLERLLAHGTLVWLLAVVDAFVLFQVKIGREALVAKRAPGTENGQDANLSPVFQNGKS